MKDYVKPALDVLEVELEGNVLYGSTEFGIGGEIPEGEELD